MTGGALTTGYPDTPPTGHPSPPPGPTDPLCAHRTRTNTRIPLELSGYDSEGAPLWPWQVLDGD